MRNKEGKEGNAEGLKIASELADAILAEFAGIYLITPLMRFDLTVALSQHVRKQTTAKGLAQTGRAAIQTTTPA
jgi:homocysteine S-methyltransferase